MYQVLIADDEQIERMVLRKTLEKHMGDLCQIYEAANGREALELYREKGIQIAILDIEMPGINGIQAAEEIRRNDPDCCIIFLTAFDEFSYAKRAIRIRAMEYLLKPYQQNELLSVLEEAVRLTEKRLESEQRPAVPEFDISPAPELSAPADSEEEEGYGRIAAVSRRIEEYLSSHYMEDISLQDAAEAMNYSEVYFCRLFKQCFSCNFTSYLTQIRIERAKQLLASPTANIKDIGEAVGYGNPNYFAKVFKRYTGTTPTEYRAEHANIG